MIWLLVAVMVALATGQPTQRLDSYNVDMSQISVSGFSAGGAMSVQFHVAFSSEIMGAASFAGAAPPMCAYAMPNSAVCYEDPAVIDVDALWQQVNQYATSGDLDDPSNMAGDRIYLFFGALDRTVHPGVALPMDQFYQRITDSNNIFRYDTMDCEHGIPMYDRGVPCPEKDGPLFGTYLNLCMYDGPFHAIDWIYGGGLVAPDYAGGNPPTFDDGLWYEYDQLEFGDSGHPYAEAWHDRGFIYVPSGCKDKSTPCKLHIMFHGCGMSEYWIGDLFAKDAGFKEVGELNNIIIVFPQVAPSANDENGCWDWWMGTGSDAVLKSGMEMTAIKKIMDRVTGVSP